MNSPEKKNLIVVGSYPSTKKAENVLIESLSRLKNHFDILLVTHLPVSENIQRMVQYFVYDHRNEMIPTHSCSYHYWVWNPEPFFYYQVTNSQPHALAVYRSVFNAANLIRNLYDDFFYVEGDCLFSEGDIKRLKTLKDLAKSNNKSATFFSSKGFIGTWAFYSQVDFFINNLYFPKTVDDYVAESNRVGSYGILENFLYKTLESRNKLDDYYWIDNDEFNDYFKESNINMIAVKNEKRTQNFSYFTEVLPVQNTEDQLAFCYKTHEQKLFEKPVDVYLDDEKITTLPIGKFYTAVRIYPKTDNFFIKFSNGDIHSFNKKTIFDKKDISFVILNEI